MKDGSATKRNRSRQAKSSPKSRTSISMPLDLKEFLKKWSEETNFSVSAIVVNLVRRARQQQVEP